MNYEEKYKNALSQAKQAINNIPDKSLAEWLQNIFPELKDSEDEKIRKELIRAFTVTADKRDYEIYGNGITYRQVLAWLEKQGEQKQHLELKSGHWYFCHQAYCERADILTVKEGEVFKCEKDGIVKGLIIKEPEKYFREISTPTDKVEPKFKVGDTIVEKDLDECGCGTIVNIKDSKYIFDDGCFIRIKEQERWQLVEQKPTDKVEPKFKVGDWITDGTSTFQIVEIEDEWYIADDGDKVCFGVVDQYYRLWTIQDAKNGDVLATGNNSICLFDGIVEEGIYPFAYCRL